MVVETVRENAVPVGAAMEAAAMRPLPRPAYKPEEGEVGRGEWWVLVKAVLIGVVCIMLVGWLISA